MTEYMTGTTIDNNSMTYVFLFNIGTCFGTSIAFITFTLLYVRILDYRPVTDNN